MPHTRHIRLPLTGPGYLPGHPIEVQKFVSKISVERTTKQVSVHHTNTHGQSRPPKTPMDGCTVTVDWDAPLTDQLLPSDLGRCVSLYLLDTERQRLKKSAIKAIFKEMGKTLQDTEFVPDIQMLSENPEGFSDSRTWTPSSGGHNSGKTRISLLEEKASSKKIGIPTYYLLVSSFPGELGSELKKYLLNPRESHGISTFGQLAKSRLLTKHISICSRSNDRLAFKVMEALGVNPSGSHMDLREPRHPNIAERFYPRPAHLNVITTVRDASEYPAEVDESESDSSEQEQDPVKTPPRKSGYRYDSGSDEESSQEDDDTNGDHENEQRQVMGKIPKSVSINPVERVPGKFVRIYYGVSDPNPANAFSGHPEHSLPYNQGIIVSGGISDNVRVYPYPLNAQERIETPFTILPTETVGENSDETQRRLSKNVHYEGNRIPGSIEHQVRNHGVLRKKDINQFENETGLDNPLKLGHVASWVN